MERGETSQQSNRLGATKSKVINTPS